MDQINIFIENDSYVILQVDLRVFWRIEYGKDKIDYFRENLEDYS